MVTKRHNFPALCLLILAILLLQNGKCRKDPTGPDMETTTTTTAAAISTTTSTVIPGTTTVLTTTTPASSTSVSTTTTAAVTTTITGSNAIAPTLSATSGKTGTVLTVSVTINQNTSTISSFGLEVEFPANMFAYVEVLKGSLTGNWSTVAANPITGSVVRIGGFAGSGTPVAAGSQGTIVALRLRVTCGACADNTAGNVCLKSYTDGIANMTPKPSCAAFTYKK
jgi:hypothetical protein